MTAADLRAQLLAESDDEEDVGSPHADPHADSTPAYSPFVPSTVGSAASSSAPLSRAVADTDEDDEAKGLAAAARVAGLEKLMSEAGLQDRLASAGAWCELNGWASVPHLRGGGPRAAEAFVHALRLKSDGARGKRLKKALKRDEWGWDAHAAAARNNSERR